jgi:hypothetical protein
MKKIKTLKNKTNRNHRKKIIKNDIESNWKMSVKEFRKNGCLVNTGSY